MAKYVRNYLIVVLITIVAVILYNVWNIENKPPFIDYTAFLTSLTNDEIRKVHLRGGEIRGEDAYGNPFMSFAPDVVNLIPKLQEKDVIISASSDRPSSTSTFWTSVFPALLIVGAWMFFMVRQQRGGGSSGFTRSKALISAERAQKVTFHDVAGVPEAKEELIEVIEFLRDPKKYTRLGGRIPKGVLLQGPPGTGKTLLAKAIAGEAGVPFFSISGSDFVEMFVGVGASRVRDLFSQAKKNAPCIVFIDEIDAVGRHRGAGAGSQGGQDEREQTLNALLVEMDGFESGDNVIIVAATNRPDVLDKALLRPGRFDRQVTILPPDVKGREEILQVYAKIVVLSPDVVLNEVARSSPGFTGAELANLMNESALMAARKGKESIELIDIEEAKDKILMGAERKGMVISDKEKKTTAFHEAGHAVLACLLPNTDPVHKITIIPRGRAMGVTQQMPLDDRHAYSKEFLTNRIKILLGGRTAEEIVFNQYTTGASNDLQTATEIASKMVCEWGMTEQLGPRAYVKPDEGFLGGSSTQRIYSEDTARAIDREINALIEDCYQEAMIILEGKIDILHQLAELLLEKETIGAEEVEQLVGCSKLETTETDMNTQQA